MKKGILMVAVMLVLVAGVFLTACTSPAPSPSPSPSPTPSPTPSPAPAPEKTYEFKMQSFQPNVMERYQVDYETFCDMVEKNTQGRVKIELYPAGALVPVPEMLKATQDNVIQMTNTVGAYVAGIMPVGNVEFSMPMSYQSFNDTWTLMYYRGLQDVLEEAYNEHGVHYLGFQCPMGNRLLTTKPIRKLSDLNGMKIRAVGTFAEFVEKLGASPVNIPMTEIYMALKLGTVEGAMTGFDVLYDVKAYEVGKYIIGSPKPSYAEPLNILINLDIWNSMSEELQTILTLTIHDWSHWAGLMIETPRMQKVTDGFEAKGVEFTTLSAEDTATMQQAAKEIWDEWAQKDDYCARAVKIMEDYFREQGRIK